MNRAQKNTLTSVFRFFRPTEKMGPDGVRRIFPTNPDLADILGRTDFDFENFYFLDFLGPEFLAWAQLGPTHLGPAWANPLGPLGWARWAHNGWLRIQRMVKDTIERDLKYAFHKPLQ